MLFLITFAIIILLLVIIRLYCWLTSGICKCSKHLVGKTVIVTGGNSGIGYETAKDLAERGARVILGCRSDLRGTAARDQIIAATGNKDVHYRKLDLASLTSVRTFADDILKSEKQLDILINNAGIYTFENEKTEDGLQVGMQVNHFGHFLLTNLLLPLLKSSAPSRIINVSSILHSQGTIDFDNVQCDKSDAKFNSGTVYNNTKLCNILMSLELSKQLKGSGVTINSVHPGIVATNMPESAKPTLVLKYVFLLVKLVIMKTSWEGAQTSIYTAVAPELANVSGRFFKDCKDVKPSKLAQDENVARKLWEVSERLVWINKISFE